MNPNMCAAWWQVHEAAAGGDCSRTIQRRAIARLVPPEVEIGAVRISTNGWEDAVLEGLQVRAKRPPPPNTAQGARTGGQLTTGTQI